MARGIIKTLGLAGAALTAWYFLDPKNGSERRSNLKKSAKDLYDTAGDELERLGKDIAGGFSGTMKKVSELTHMGHQASGMDDAAARTAQDSSRSLSQEDATRQSESFGAPVGA